MEVEELNEDWYKNSQAWIKSIDDIVSGDFGKRGEPFMYNNEQ